MDVFRKYRIYLLEKYNTIWDKVNLISKKDLVVSLSIIRIIWKPEENLMVMKL